MNKSTQQNKGALAILANALARLQEGRSVDSEDIWLGKSANELSPGRDESSVVERPTSAINTINYLKRVSELLDSLSVSCKTFTNTLKEKSMPVILQHGIMKLPDEILEQIFECIHDSHIQSSEYDLEESGQNSRTFVDNQIFNICRRFRQVALNMPSLWSTLSSNMPHEAFAFYLSRSKNADLTIIFKSSSFGTPFMEFDVINLLPHRHRWKALVVECECWVPIAWESADNWLGKLPWMKELELPALRCLTVRAVGGRSSDAVTKDGVEDFFSRWKTPRLRRLDLSSVIPSRIHNYGDIITSLTFNFSNMDVSLYYFFSFLNTLPKLEDFSLVGLLPTTLLTETYEHRASFPSLSSLTLRKCDNATLKFILTTFDMPQVSSLVLDMNLASHAGMKDLSFLNILYDHTSLISQIKSLSLTLDHSRSDVHPHGALDHLFMNFTALEHFSLSSIPTRPYLATGKILEGMMFHSLKKHPLKTVRVKDCTDLSACLPRTLYYLVGRKREESRFRKLEIVGRTNFVEKDFSAELRDKVVWVPDDSS